MNQKLLEGEVVESRDSSELERLRDVNRTLTRELSQAHDENADLRRRLSVAGAPVERLREKLGPFYQLLQSIFGDIEDLSPEPSGQTSTQPSRPSPVWESWKTRLAGAPAKIIDAMLLHGEVTVEQLVVLTQISRKQTIYDAISRMNKSGIINKNGGRFSLKKLG